jgi:hypothetical protein
MHITSITTTPGVIAPVIRTEDLPHTIRGLRTAAAQLQVTGGLSRHRAIAWLRDLTNFADTGVQAITVRNTWGQTLDLIACPGDHLARPCTRHSYR